MWLIRACLALALFGMSAASGFAQDGVRIASQPANGERVPALERPARFEVREVPLLHALSELKRQAEVALAFSADHLPGADLLVTCLCGSVSVRDALDELLDHTGLVYAAVNDHVVIHPAHGGSRAFIAPQIDVELVRSEGIAMARGGHRPFIPRAEPGVITGRVTDQALAPVSGAVVTLARAGLSALSNASGAFSIDVPASFTTPPREDTLRVERLGYRSASELVTLAPGTVEVNVILSTQAVRLDEVLVTGTVGRQERRAQGADVAIIDASRIIETASISGVHDLLTARVPGVSVTGSSGAIGSTALVRIRGVSSISLSNEPLIFVDGVRVDYRNMQLGGGTAQITTLTDLDPSQIESVEVVKGPAAATLYGADASTGVIQIITKRGTPGQRHFTQSVTADLATINPAWTPPANFARCGAAHVGPDSPNPLCRGREVGELVSDNPLLREGLLTDGSGSALRWSGRGGGDSHGYFLSYRYTKETGVIPQNAIRQHSGRLNASFLPHETVTVDGRIGLSHEVNTQPQLGDGAYSLLLALVGTPLSLGTAADGWLIPGRTGEALSSIENEFTSQRTSPMIEVRHAPREWLNQHLTLGGDLSRVYYRRFMPRNDRGWYSAVENTGFLQERRSIVNTFTLNYLGNVSRTMGDTGDWNATVSLGAQLIAQSVDDATSTGIGFAANESNVISSAAERAASGLRSDQRSLGYLGQVQIGHRDRLFLQLAARLDQNSAFGAERGSVFLPKIGASYVVSDEEYWQRTAPFINTFLVRGAFGTTGRSPTPGASLRTFSPSPVVAGPGTTMPGVTPLNPGNENLRPEKGTELEVGFDAAGWDDRVGVAFSFFNKVTDDLLLARPLAPSLGFIENPFMNIGRVLNRGIELSLRGTLLERQGFGWQAEIGMNTLHNELLELGDVEPIQFGLFGHSHYREGEPLGSLYSPAVIGVDVAAGHAIVSDTAVFMGTSIPTLEGTLTNTLRIGRHIRATGSLEMKRGHVKWNATDWFRERNSSSTERFQRRDEMSSEDRLRHFGPYVTAGGVPVAASGVLEEYMQDASFVRLREVSVTLNVPSTWLNQFRASRGTLTVGGRNLGLWTEYGGMDPESLSHLPIGGLERPMEFNILPQTRRLFIRLSMDF